MATLKEFEDALRDKGFSSALAILEELRTRDRLKRSMAPAHRISGRKMTAQLAQEVLNLHSSTGMTQQEIAFQLGINQGRANEVIKRGKWLSDNPSAPEAIARDKAVAKIKGRTEPTVGAAHSPRKKVSGRSQRRATTQMAFSGF